MLRIVARLSASAETTPRRSPEISVTSAASIATSVPVPIAMPTSAWASAGASLMPSPTMPTCGPRPGGGGPRRPCPRGSTSASTRSMPTWRAIASAVRRVVAGDHHDLDAQPLERAMAGGRVRLDRVRDGDHPGGPPSTATSIGVFPSADKRSVSASSVERSRPASASRAAWPTSTWCPSTVARTPWPVTESNSARRERPRGASAPPTIAAAERDARTSAPPTPRDATAVLATGATTTSVRAARHG